MEYANWIIKINIYLDAKMDRNLKIYMLVCVLRNIYACVFQNLRAIPAKCLSIE